VLRVAQLLVAGICEKLLRTRESIGEAEMEKHAVIATDLKLTRPTDLIELFVSKWWHFKYFVDYGSKLEKMEIQYLLEESM
jgi:hypothetical protein